MQSRSTGSHPARRDFCGACMQALAARLARCWGRKRMRRIAITCTSTWLPASRAPSASDEKAIEPMPNFLKLRPFDDDGNLNMVVETPRGSTVKLKYEPKTKVFTV